MLAVKNKFTPIKKIRMESVKITETGTNVSLNTMSVELNKVKEMSCDESFLYELVRNANMSRDNRFTR